MHEKINSVYELLVNSVQLENEESKFKKFLKLFLIEHSYIHSHKYLELILQDISVIKNLHPDNEWLIDVFILVTFHQSLPNIRGRMNKTLLEEKYIKQIFDLRLLELMRIVMVNDSAAHTLFSGEVFTEEINENLNAVREFISKK